MNAALTSRPFAQTRHKGIAGASPPRAGQPDSEKGYVKHPDSVWTDKSYANEGLCAQLIEAIRARVKAATLGPWRAWHHPPERFVVRQHVADRLANGDYTNLTHGPVMSQEDAAFIANAREDIPYLLDRLDEYRAVVEAAKRWRRNHVTDDDRWAPDALIAAVDALAHTPAQEAK